jgi:hypothetical protein
VNTIEIYLFSWLESTLSLFYNNDITEFEPRYSLGNQCFELQNILRLPYSPAYRGMPLYTKQAHFSIVGFLVFVPRYIGMPNLCVFYPVFSVPFIKFSNFAVNFFCDRKLSLSVILKIILILILIFRNLSLEYSYKKYSYKRNSVYVLTLNCKNNLRIFWGSKHWFPKNIEAQILLCHSYKKKCVSQSVKTLNFLHHYWIISR